MKYTVLCAFDCASYAEVEVEAESIEAATQKTRDLHKQDAFMGAKWRPQMEAQYDARIVQIYDEAGKVVLTDGVTFEALDNGDDLTLQNHPVFATKVFARTSKQTDATRTIELPYGIVVTLADGAWAIKDSLHEEINADEASPDWDGPEDQVYKQTLNAMFDGLTSAILAHAAAGVDIDSAAYKRGVLMAVETCLVNVD